MPAFARKVRGTVSSLNLLARTPLATISKWPCCVDRLFASEKILASPYQQGALSPHQSKASHGKVVVKGKGGSYLFMRHEDEARRIHC